MIRLTHEQLDRIEQLIATRRARAIALVLEETWPALPERLKDRWGAFVEAAVLRGHDAGMQRVESLTRYASLWCLWGAAFEDKPGFEWAREILADPKRNEALRLHQLMHRTREELLRRQAAAPVGSVMVTAAQFDAATLALDRRIGQVAAAKAVFLDEVPLAPLKACDIGSVDLMVAEPEGLQEYRHGETGWQRTAATKPTIVPLHWDRAPVLPTLLAVVSNPLRGGPVARLNLKIAAHAVCDPRVHPSLVHASPEHGRLEWKGRDTARLSLALYARAVPPAEDGGPRGIAAPVAPESQRIELASCGVRDAGAPFGDAPIEIAVHPATQWFTELRHAAWPAMAWPGGAPAQPAALSVRLESDGTPRDAATWQRGWLALQVQARQGLERLFNAWARGKEGPATRLDAELSPLVGQAGLTWGYRRVDAATAALRSEGRVDLIACALDLQFATELTIDGATARVKLAAKGRSDLRMAVQQIGDQAAEGAGLAVVVRNWRFPFAVEVEPLVGAGIATLHALPTPEAALGAVVGEAGLRPRPDGAGLQWFFALRCDAVSVQLAVSDPITGDARHTRSLLPAMTIVDWSAG